MNISISQKISLLSELEIRKKEESQILDQTSKDEYNFQNVLPLQQKIINYIPDYEEFTQTSQNVLATADKDETGTLMTALRGLAEKTIEEIQKEITSEVALEQAPNKTVRLEPQEKELYPEFIG